MLYHVNTQVRSFLPFKNTVTKAAISTVPAGAPRGPWGAGDASVRRKSLPLLLGNAQPQNTATHRLKAFESTFVRSNSIQRGLELERRIKVNGIPFANWTPSGYVIIYKDQPLDLQTSVEIPVDRMQASVQILTVPTADTPGTTVMLQCNDQRYLFGDLSEGSQRVAIEHDWKLSKVTNMFLTGRVEWKSTGGLLGLILTLAESVQAAQTDKLNHKKSKDSAKSAQIAEQKDSSPNSPSAEKQRLHLYGGPNLTHLIATARKFIFRKGMPLEINELDENLIHSSPQPIWSDKHVRVWAMGVNPTAQKETSSISPSSSPRKRSFDEFSEYTGRERLDDKKVSVDKDHQTRKAVVGDMFDSNWRLDTLVEMPLNQVQMPANIFVRNAATHKIEKFPLPKSNPNGQAPLPNINVLVRKPWPAALVSELPRTTPSNTATSYFVRCHAQRGKFQVHKAVALNVKPGPLFADLTNGKSVLSQDGKEVHPQDVLGPDNPGNGFAVIDIPSPLYVKALIEKPEWKFSEIVQGLKFVLWNLGPDVGENEDLRAFMLFLKTMFKITNLISSSDYCPNVFGFQSVARSAYRLRQIDPVRFPKIKYRGDGPKDTKYFKRGPDDYTGIVAWQGWNWNLHPQSYLQSETDFPLVDISATKTGVPPEIKALAMSISSEANSEKVQNEIRNQNLPSAEAEIICLGTGSAQPSKYRNVSSTLLRVPGCGSYMLDCGENTLGQLRRVYNDDELAEVLRDLKMIWISHLHADHHLGIVSVIKAWHRAVHGSKFTSLDEYKSNLADQPFDPSKDLRELKRLFIASDAAMNQWLAEYASIEDYGYDKLIPIDVVATLPDRGLPGRLTWRGTNMSFEKKDDEMKHAMRAATGLLSLKAANVDHCNGAKAVCLTFPDGFKFAFSGDCRPSKDFIKISEGCTVLLHEATFDDELQGDALAKKHCTISEAIGVGKAMGARRVLLTHFSQRYQKIPVMSSLTVKIEDTPEVGDKDSTGNKDSEASGHVLDEFDLGPVADGEFTRQGDTQLPKAEENQLQEPLSSPQKNNHGSIDNKSTSDLTSLSSSATTKYAATNELSMRADDFKVGVAFDYMRVKVKDIMLLEKWTPALTALFDYYEKEKVVEKERNKAAMADRDEQKVKKTEKVLEAQVLKKGRKEQPRSHKEVMKTTGIQGGATDAEMKEVVGNEANRAEDETAKHVDHEEAKEATNVMPEVVARTEHMERKDE